MNEPTNEAMSRASRTAKHLLVDRRFQLKYTGMIVAAATVLSLFLGGFLFTKVRENSRILELEALEDTAFSAQLAGADQALFLTIALSIAAFLLVLSVLSIVITHRMAGPIFVMKSHLQTLARGELPQVRTLRKGDEFTPLYKVLTQTVAVFEEEAKRECELISRTLAVLADLESPALSGLRRDLETRLEEKQKTLESTMPESGIEDA